MVYDHAKPVGSLRFNFESGDLSGWKVVEGKFDELVTKREGLPNHPQQPFNKQGTFLVFTGNRGDQKAGDDSFIGVIESPALVLSGKQMSFLVGGGGGDNTYVALCSKEGKELRTASGADGPALRRINWDVGDYQGETLRLRIVDRSQRGWGHVTFDDFSCDAELATKVDPSDTRKSSPP